MNILIKLSSINPICSLSLKIAQDWCKKMKADCELGGANSLICDFKILVTDNRQFSTLEPKSLSNFNLVVVVQGADMDASHILALSGQLSTFGQTSTPFVPSYVAEIIIANCVAITIIQTIFSNLHTPLPQKQNSLEGLTNSNDRVFPRIHTLSCIQCVKYFGAFNISSKDNGMMGNKRGQNILDGGAPFYAIYPTKQGLLAVGNLEPKFYEEMIQQMGLESNDKQFCLQNQLNFDSWPKLRRIFSEKFLQKSAVQWEKTMDSRDTCVTVVKNYQKMQKNYLHPYLIKPNL